MTVSINRNTLTNYNKATKDVTSNTHHYITQFTVMINLPSLQNNRPMWLFNRTVASS